jgi:hypothetical protein
MALLLVFLIFIWIGSGFRSGSESRRAKMTHKIEKIQEISCFEVLDVLLKG